MPTSLSQSYQSKWRRSRRLAWIEDQGGRCIACGSREGLEVDHIDPSQKVEHRVWSWNRERREAELAKCQVLCRGCHKAKTAKDIGSPEHGVTGYRERGCRCSECRAGNRDRQRRYRVNRATRRAA